MEGFDFQFKKNQISGATYLVLQLCGGTSLSVGLTFAINLSYLLAGYWYAIAFYSI